MKKFFFLVLSLAGISIYSQSVDLDRRYVKMEYINLPSNPIETLDDRTYSVKTNVNGLQTSYVLETLKIDGFKKVDENASIEIDFQINPIKVNNIAIREVEELKKDKDGNVTQRIYYYYADMEYDKSGFAKVKNNITKNTKNIPLDRKGFYKSPNFGTRSAASEHISINRGNLIDKYQQDFISESAGIVTYDINNLYGYPIREKLVLFWIMDSKKHPENSAHSNIFSQIKELLAKIKPEEPITESLRSELKPIEEYLLGNVSKYPSDKRPDRKIRYASYYNLGVLYNIFEMPDKAIEMANKLIENGYDKSDGNYIISQAEKLKSSLLKNKTNTGYFKIINPQ